MLYFSCIPGFIGSRFTQYTLSFRPWTGVSTYPPVALALIFPEYYIKNQCAKFSMAQQSRMRERESTRNLL